ncbi:sacsin N-terminal ATP-binding-like domain-containing protein [Aerosakkonema funiforme]|uniref:sacsin N-terminal ATP-binding-like domain-containing protein n=1 Tax=Aerosakkonema funiforme TaxID=1246630 RepID=UPI0035B72883
MSEFNNNAITFLNRLTAKKIEEKMRPLRMSPTENSKRRWIWELLQNAKDKAAIDFPEEQVSVFINFNQNFIEFSHNFGFFSTNNIEGIIRQISSDDKDREEVDKTEIPKTTGRFGTGFMTTHLLSEKVNVRGIYKNSEYSFQKIEFPLDRSGRELSKLIESINNSFDCAEKSLIASPKFKNINFSDFNTIFRYELDEKGKVIAQIGLNDLEISLPYTLIFIDRIKYVKVTINNEDTIYDKQAPYKLTNEIKIVEFDKTQNGRVERLYFACLSKGLTSIAIQIDKVGERIFLKEFDKNTPKLFLDFPLIGTEDFNFPVTVNNPFLEPTEPRDGVFLTNETDEHIINNKKVIQDAIELYFLLLEHATNSNWQNLYFLAKTDLPKEKDWIAKDWYKSQVQKVLRAKLLKTEIVYPSNPEQPKIALENALFPYHTSKAKIPTIWEFANALWHNRLPKKEHIEFWYEVIDKSWEKDLHYDLRKLVSDIASLSNVSQLANRTNRNEEETLNWLNRVIEFVVAEDQKLLSDYAIIPNQYNVFRKKEELSTDNKIPKELKDVLKILQEDWRRYLKHPKITSGNLVQTKGINDIVVRINQIIKENINPHIKEACLQLISCFPDDSALPKVRYDLWKFAKDFYQNIPDKQGLEDWIPTVWEECDKWLIHKLIDEISQKQNVSNLTKHLSEDSLKWLNKFVNFIVESEFDAHLNEYAILPNQRGDFKKKKELFVDDKIDETLKDILEDLGNDYRGALLATEIVIDIEDKTRTSKDIAIEIREKVEEILQNEGIGNRKEKTKQIFSKLLLWFHENERLANKIFSELYEKRHRLRSDEEIIADIKFRQALLSNSNGYTQEEIIKLVNMPKDNLVFIPPGISKDKLEEIFQNLQQEKDEKVREGEPEYLSNPEDILISLGITTIEELERAKQIFAPTKMGRILYRISSYSAYSALKFEYVLKAIERAKKNVKAYLSSKNNYNCDNWYEESLTVIAGVRKDDRPIKIVVRPSDGRKVIIYYQSELDALESPDTELWVDDSTLQEIVTLGKVLKRIGRTSIPW